MFFRHQIDNQTQWKIQFTFRYLGFYGFKCPDVGNDGIDIFFVHFCVVMVRHYGEKCIAFIIDPGGNGLENFPVCPVPQTGRSNIRAVHNAGESQFM